MSDFTYVSTWGGMVYVAFVIDAYLIRELAKLEAITVLLSRRDGLIPSGPDLCSKEGFDMSKILTSGAVALALSFAAANAPAKAQGSPAPFDSAYAQPGNLVDGLDIGTRVSDFESVNAQQLANEVGGFAAGPRASSGEIGRLKSVEPTDPPAAGAH